MCQNQLFVMNSVLGLIRDWDCKAQACLVIAYRPSEVMCFGRGRLFAQKSAPAQGGLGGAEPLPISFCKITTSFLFAKSSKAPLSMLFKLLKFPLKPLKPLLSPLKHS